MFDSHRYIAFTFMSLISRRMALCLVVFLQLLYTGNINAHAKFTMNSAAAPRYDSAEIKDLPGTPLIDRDPCGDNVSITRISITKTNIKTIFDVTDDKTILLEWQETVEHPGHFLFDFSFANDTFEPIQNIVNDDTVRLTQSLSFDLPGITCENCTIRLRQTMVGPGDIAFDPDILTKDTFHPYYSCADIAIVDKMLTDTPANVINILTPTLSDTSLTLSWENPAAAFSEIVVVRKTLVYSNATMDETLNNFIHYPVGQNIGTDPTSVVVYRGKATEFSDSGLTSETNYGYKIFARNANYNYNQGSLQTVLTTSSSSNPEPTPTPTGDSTAAGALYTMILILAGFLGLRTIYSWRKRAT